MMEQTRKDPLLLAAKGVLWLMIALLGVALLAVAVGAPVVAIVPERILSHLASEGIAAGTGFIPAVTALLALLAGLLGAAVYFLVLLLRIVNSVQQGDPFVADNADRLARMGWIALALQILAIPVGALVMWIAEVTKDAGDLGLEVDVGVNLTAILLTLILFILARVFRHGTAMREDLEGTV